MAEELKTKPKFFSPVAKTVITPTVFLLVLVAAGTLFVKVGVPRISSQRERLTTAQKEEAVLFEKNTLLSAVAKSITQTANSSLAALPSKNSGTQVISALKNLSSEKGVIVSNLTLSSPKSDENSISSASISFDLETQVLGVFDFIDSLGNLAPITRLEVVTINQEESTQVANVSLKIYWSSLPAILPALTEPLPPLGEEERVVISDFASLNSPPTFGQVVPVLPSARADPFN